MEESSNHMAITTQQEAERIIYLTSGFLLNRLTDQETEELLQWQDAASENKKLFTDLTTPGNREAALRQLSEYHTENALAIVKTVRQPKEKAVDQHRKINWRYATAIAASLLLFITASLFYFLHSQHNRQLAAQHQDVLPGKNQAILTLTGGRKIILGNIGNGLIASQTGVQINKNNKGQLIYQIIAATPGINDVEYNTITTPNGGQYQIILEDGTKVWLNAASSLHYPASFTGSNRMVELTGEGYFEVAHNKERPFIVRTGTQSVTVLGTHFNINSYADEAAITTTLLQGSVMVTINSEKHVLKPGQQSISRTNNIEVQDADTEAATAWKDGQFIFHNADLKTIMRQVQRWYNVEVDMTALPDEQFNGAMSRDVKLSQVLNMLEVTSKLKFKIEGRRIMLVK